MEESVSLEALLNPMKSRRDVAVVGPRIVGLDGNLQTPWKKVSARNLLFLYYVDLLLPKKCKITRWISNLDTDKKEGSRYAYWLTGSFLLVDAERF